MKTNLGIVDGYHLSPDKPKKREPDDLQIIFIRNHKIFVRSMIYKNVSPEKRKRVEKKLEELISYNNDCITHGERHRALSMISILEMAEEIIYENEE